MSQMFETDIGALLESGNIATRTHLMKTINNLQGLRERVVQLETDQLRLLDLIDKMVALDKTRAQAFDQLHERVGRAEDLARLRQELVDLLRERVETLEKKGGN